MLYIADIEVIHSEYMGEEKHYKTVEIVEAKDYHEATKKIEEYYRKKSESYSHYYTVNIIEIRETIT